MPSNFHSLSKKRKAKRFPQLPHHSRVVVVGNGMVGANFCEELIAHGLHERFAISAIGAESVPAYNRVRLSSYVKSQDPAALELRSREWYEQHQISLTTGVSVAKIRRADKTLELSDGSEVPYDLLVLATGSRPFIPPIPGADHPQVFPYRTIDDLQRIIEAAEGKKSATIVGGGLLGIEAAQALQNLELETSIIERARFLMPQQLTGAAGELLRKKVEEAGITIHTDVQSTTVAEDGDQLELTLNESEKKHCDLVVISAGIQPNSEIAEAAGLPVGVRGGVVVNDDLETEDPAIFAVGECALLHGRTYGLVAPGNVMAKHLASRLAGKKQKPLGPLDLSTRLKMLGVDVITVGEPLQEGRQVEFQQDGIYRCLTLGRKSQLIGALAIGPWEENNLVHTAFQQGQKISSKQTDYFAKEGTLFPNQKVEDPSQWSDEQIVCNCTGTPKGAIVACLAKCPNIPDSERLSFVATETGASSVCGSCQPLISQLAGAPASVPVGKKSIVGLLVASALALAVTAYTIFGPPAPMATSVESTWYEVDQLWRDFFLKQISGYSLMAIFTIGLLISLRKRLKWFKWGKFASWRFFHSAFGLTSLIALWAHTGFHFGRNLNWWLMFVFVALNLLGAVAGIVAAMEAKGGNPTARRLRPLLTKAHIILFWPLPVLLTFHILSAYLY